MISSHEMRSNTMKVIAAKLLRGDLVADALDTVCFKQAVLQMNEELKGTPATLYCEYPLCGLRMYLTSIAVVLHGLHRGLT